VITRLLTTVWLTVVWVLLWGTASVANLVTGLAVALLLTFGFPIARSASARVRPVAVVRLGLWFVGALVVANLRVAREVVRPRLRLDQGLVAVPLRATSMLVTAFVANAISLTPGTLTVEALPDPDTAESADSDIAHVLHVHSLTTSDPAVVRAQCLAVETLVVAAFGTAEDRDRLARDGDGDPQLPGQSEERR